MSERKMLSLGEIENSKKSILESKKKKNGFEYTVFSLKYWICNKLDMYYRQFTGLKNREL